MLMNFVGLGLWRTWLSVDSFEMEMVVMVVVGWVHVVRVSW